MTLLEERMKEAIEKKSTDINSFMWKGIKVLNTDGKYEQTEKRLADMGSDELNSCYDHCKKMLFNKDTQNPGRHVVLAIISDQKNRCGAELFLRYIEQDKEMSRFNLLSAINSFNTANKEYLKHNTAVISDAFSGVPDEYQEIPLDLVVDGCLDRLGAFNKKHITRTFILKQGIWLTSSEVKEIIGDTKVNDRLEVIRELLGIKDVEKLSINSKGINYSQMRAMLNLKPNKKYRDLTTVQLETLRYRILFNLEETVLSHIISWEKRMEEIELVADHNRIKLV